jgi:hypothetical protein
MSNQYTEAANENIMDSVVEMDRFDILRELRVSLPRFTTPLETLQDLLIEQRIEEANDRWACYDGPQGDD